MLRFYLYILYLVVVWGAFRYFVSLPEVVEELWFKPLIWLIPVFWWNMTLKRRVYLYHGSWPASVGLGVLVGLAYFVLFGGWKNLEHINLDFFGVILATAVVEETVFSGFLASYIERYLKFNMSLVVVGLSVVLSRLPVLFFVFKLGGLDLLGSILIIFSTGIIHAWLRLRTNNVWGSIIARVFLGLVK